MYRVSSTTQVYGLPQATGITSHVMCYLPETEISGDDLSVYFRSVPARIFVAAQTRKTIPTGVWTLQDLVL